MQHAAPPLKITTGKFEVIASGLVHIIDKEVTFKLGGLTIQYVFKSESKGGGARLHAESTDNKLIVTVYNFSNALGEGKIEPMEIGTLSGRKLFATFFVNTIDNKELRQFHYTFMLMKGAE